MAYTVGRFDIGVLGNLAALMACFYATCLFFIVVVLGGVAAAFGFNIFKFIRLRRVRRLRDEDRSHR